mgnify:CR=1 FL=1
MERGHEFVLRLEGDHVGAREGGCFSLGGETCLCGEGKQSTLGGIARKFPDALLLMDGGFVAENSGAGHVSTTGSLAAGLPLSRTSPFGE